MVKKKKISKTKSQGSFIGNAIKFVFVTGLWIGIFGALLLAWYAQELPSITKEAEFQRKTSITIKAADGSVLTRYGEVMGNSVTTEDIPPHLIYAVLAIEDRRFYYHFGIDPLGLLRAVFVNIGNGGVVQGGSTISQQLAKNLFLSQERTFKRKIQEAMLALWLEWELSKDDILAAYLNRVYLGGGVYGVDAAARYYFNKDVKDISVRESAILAGMLKAPSRYSPLNNPGLANQRANLVLKTMVESGYITEEEASNLTKLPPRPSRKPSGEDSVRYYTDWVVDGLDDLIGTPKEDIVVYTTLNPRVQEAAETALVRTLMNSGEERHMTQGAIVSMAMDGAVVALVGGRDYGLSQFNRATQGKRPAGSSFKPFVFLTALEQGWSPDDLILDAPFEEGRYRPKNFGYEYYGDIDLFTALTFSLNTATVRLAKAVGIDSVILTARNLGIISPLQPDLSTALGSSGVSLLEMATAYTAIGNGGHKMFPYAITKIENESGTLYYQRQNPGFGQQVIGTRSLQNIKAMMSGVIDYGTGQGAKVPFPAAGKTGTSQESRDALFIGFSNEMTTAVWVGNDDNSPMKNVTGGSFPARIWREVMVNSRGLFKSVGGGFDNSSFLGLLNSLTSSDERDTIEWSKEKVPFERVSESDRFQQEILREETGHMDNKRYND